MKTSDVVRIAGVVGVLGTSTVGAQPRFAALGFLDFPWSQGLGISADGMTIVGWSYVGSLAQPEAFRWTEAQGMVGLGRLPGLQSWSRAAAVSGDGSVIVGALDVSSVRQPSMWPPGGQLTPLGWPHGGHQSVAHAISDDGGVFAGSGLVSLGSPFGDVLMAFSWENGVFTLIEPTSPPPNYTRAWGMSADGLVVVGENTLLFGPIPTAFRWTKLEGMRELGRLAGGTWSIATAASGDGSIIAGIADSSLRPGSNEMFRWTESTGVVGLGLLPDGSDTRALDMTPDGSTIVGDDATFPYSFPAGEPSKATIWTESGGMRTVEAALLERGRTVPMGWQLISATGVSDDGLRIVGWGKNPENLTEAWLVDLSGCYADCDGSGVFDVLDYQCFQQAFLQGDQYADCDGNSAFDIFDFLCFQDAFVARCP